MLAHPGWPSRLRHRPVLPVHHRQMGHRCPRRPHPAIHRRTLAPARHRTPLITASTAVTLHRSPDTGHPQASIPEQVPHTGSRSQQRFRHALTQADAMKERSLPLPGGCWKLQSIRLHQAREAPVEDYDGRQVVGMDLHRRRSVLVRMTEDGRRLGTAKITNSPAALRKEIARAGKHPKVVLEATYGWYWAADVLAAAGAEVHLAHPLGVKAFTYRRVKDDVRDSADLADLLRMGRLPEAWIAPHEVRELRELTRYRIKLVHLRTSCKDQVHGVLAKLGVPVTCSDIFGVAGSAWLDGLRLPQPYAGKVTSLRHLAGELTTEITMLSEVIASLLAGDRGYQVIQQLPGIGPV